MQAMTLQTNVEREKDRATPSPTPAKVPETDRALPRKAPKSPKPRKVEKRQRGRKG